MPSESIHDFLKSHTGTTTKRVISWLSNYFVNRVLPKNGEGKAPTNRTNQLCEKVL